MIPRSNIPYTACLPMPRRLAISCGVMRASGICRYILHRANSWLANYLIKSHQLRQDRRWPEPGWGAQQAGRAEWHAQTVYNILALVAGAASACASSTSAQRQLRFTPPNHFHPILFARGSVAVLD
jgi:hypothetical protein